ncbi:Tyrosine protein kinase and Adenylyl cyclase class-3 4 guanylyl cyclase domain containing protein [Aphelenchoides besseyi]|nr:Tyrosine protein kinase and Adenylyl cyclase class-3 4 guanylyl cyclase domain containing protein [Aphelenchoides besseyi]
MTHELYVFGLIFLCCFLSSCLSIKLGLIESEPNLIAICQHAINDAKAAKQCDSSVELLNQTGCLDGQAAIGTVNVANMFFRESIQGVIPGRCDGESLEIARLAYFWDLPVISRIGTTASLNNRNLYPTVTQISEISAVTMGQAVQQLMKALGLNDIVIASPVDDVEDYPLSMGVQTYLISAGVNIQDFVQINEDKWSYVKESVNRIRTRVKLVAIDAEFHDLSAVLNTLDIDGMGSNGYLILLLCHDTITVCPISLLSKFQRSNLVVLTPAYENQNARSQLITQWVSGNPFENLLYANYLAVYNACYGFCYGSTLTTPPNGKSFTNSLKSKSFEGKLGTVTLDGGANIVYAFLFQRLVQDNLSTIVVARSIPTTCSNQGCSAVVLDPHEFKVWEENLKQPITPCYYEGNCTSYVPIVAGTAAGLLVVLLVGGAYFYRRQQRLDRFRLHWKIQKNQLKVIENKQSKSKSMMPSGEESKASTLVSKRRAIQAYALIGTSKAEFVVLKQLKKIRWLKPELKYISELKRINHDNLTTFLGLSYNEGDRFYILHSLVERASLDNFITDQDFTMDSTFKSAFLRDIITGLQYLHKSPVGFHGLLSSQNCLIDANWVLKLTNFGIVNLLNAAIEREQLKLMEIISFNSYFTVAPENLVDIAYGRMFPRGSRQGDIYSFGMIIFEILFRRPPFESNNLTAKEVIEEVKNKGIKPDVTDALPEEKPLIDIMEQAWSKTPESRPKLRILNQVISSTFESSKGNLIDQMIRMNFSYAQHLERVVAERTAEFETQKQMNARLLRQLLPGLIAEKLMTGESVEPRSYDAATVLFCQLVDFGRFLGQTAPHNVIRFLNDVFTRFDEVISQHDAYKVETTGETYMVASGVPQENDNRHVFEISEIALQLRDVCEGYKVDHIPDWKVQVRIGYHCGPIAAGIVGARAPRFCLFGDTVNFASRMQSNCPPNQIQMSEPTAMLLMPIARYKLMKRGIVRVKGKGDVNTYWLNENVQSIKSEIESLPPVENTKTQIPVKLPLDSSTENQTSTPPDPVHSTGLTVEDDENSDKENQSRIDTDSEEIGQTAA